MRPTSISVNVRYSKPLPDGSHKTVDLGCEATLTSSGEDWQTAQQELYRQLGEQMRQVFSTNGTGKPAQEQPGNTPASPNPNWCPEHDQEWKLRNGPHGSFRSHQIKGTKPAQWCNQPGK
jgi:hypothetical protein